MGGKIIVTPNPVAGEILKIWEAFIMELADGMSIENYSIANAQNNVMQAVNTAMLSKALDMQEMQGAELTKMMELSVNPNLGGSVDVRI